MNRFLMFLILVLFAFFILSPSHAFSDDSDTDEKLSFVWAFGAIKNDSGSVEVVNIDRDIKLKKGDQIKMLVQLKTHCSVYVVHLGSQGEISLLFPETIGHYKRKAKIFIPKGDYWFTLDEDKGKEVFYLLASKTPLTSLEDLFDQYNASDQSGKAKQADLILSEIRKLKKQNRKSLRASAEKPVSLGGTFRGIKKEQTDHLIAKHSIKISAKDFYSKTFTIEHE